jgi:hypothetical protein
MAFSKGRIGTISMVEGIELIPQLHKRNSTHAIEASIFVYFLNEMSIQATHKTSCYSHCLFPLIFISLRYSKNAIIKKRQNGIHLQWRLCIYQHHSENVYHHQERQFFHQHQPSSSDLTSHVQGECAVCLPSIPRLGFLAILLAAKINKTVTAFINQPCAINSGPQSMIDGCV